MLEKLLEIDKIIFLKLNQLAWDGLDPVMLFLSGGIPWILFAAGVLFILIKRCACTPGMPNLLIAGGLLILAVILSEQISVHLFKETFERLRPCHEPDLAGQVRLVAERCGGQYGFVSTHTSNSFALATLSLLIIRQRWFSITILIWAALISYSRIYLGVHYPGDVIGGMLLGGIIGGILYVPYRLIGRKRTVNREPILLHH